MTSPFPRIGERRDAPTVTQAGFQPPTAEFSSASAGGHAMQFTDLSTDPDGQVIGWQWDFGDAPAAPTADFRFVVNGLVAQFTDLSTDVPPGTIASWAWDFGDGSTSTSQNPSHTYAAAGSYPVKLTVTDNSALVSPVPAQKTVLVGVAGRPWGPFTSGFASNTSLATITPGGYKGYFTVAAQGDSASGLVAHINAARGLGIKVFLNMTGGDHAQYITAGKFELINGGIAGSKWAKKMDTYNNKACRDAVAQAVADDLVLGCSVLDEPHSATWGNVLTKSLVDDMATYVRNIFPTLPVGVAVDYAWHTSEHFASIDFIITQYSTRKGSVTTYRDAALAVGTADGVKVIFSINVINATIAGAGWDCPQPSTEGRGSTTDRCRSTAAQLSAAAAVLGPAGVALSLWKQDDEFMGRSDNQTVMASILSDQQALARQSFRR